MAVSGSECGFNLFNIGIFPVHVEVLAECPVKG